MNTSFDWGTDSLTWSETGHKPDQVHAAILAKIDHYFVNEHNETSNRTRSLNTSRGWTLKQMALRRIFPNSVGQDDAEWSLIQNAVFALTSNIHNCIESMEEIRPTITPNISHNFHASPVGYHDRIADLKEIAEDEGIQPDPQSLQCFARFLKSQGFPLRVGALFLLDNGTYAAVWRNDQWRLNLTFHGDGSIEYVLLNREAEKPDGEADRVDLEGFSDLRDRLKLEPLLKA